MITIEKEMKITPFDDLSWFCLLFLIDRTDFSEPSMCGFGFASNVEDEILGAAKRKCAGDSFQLSVLDNTLKIKRWRSNEILSQ